jgi:hypothetical protein
MERFRRFLAWALFKGVSAAGNEADRGQNFKEV